MLKSLLSAFLMYSKIPVPQVEWKEENRRYSLCFFSLIGAVIGVIFVLWNFVSLKFGFGKLFTGAVSMLISYLITGGIHLDGFCDVSDAVCSYGSKEKRLEIMKDSHIGAFASINLAVCLIVQTAVYSEVKKLRSAIIIALGFVLSRALSGIGAVCFKSAKSDGALQSFVRPSHKKITLASLIIMLIITVSAMICTDWVIGVVSAVSAFSVFAYYRISAYKRFGGITGDVAGWFLVLCETVIGLTAVVISRIMEVL